MPPHRAAQVRELEAYLQAVVERPRQAAQIVFLCGPLSRETGYLSKTVGTAAERRAAERGEKVKFLFVDCRIDMSLVAMFNKALRSLGHAFPSRGLGFEALLQSFLETIREEGVHLVIAFGSFDLLVESDPSALFTLTELSKISRSYQAFSCMLISKSLDYLSKVDPSTRKSLPESVVVLEPYSAEQLYDMLLYRSKEAFREGAVDDMSLQMAAELASVRGDARFAVELLYVAGKFAQRAGSERVSPRHVKLAYGRLAKRVRLLGQQTPCSELKSG